MIDSAVIALDLDGTLLHSNQEVSRRNLEAVLSCYESGKNIVIATARPPRSVHALLPKALLELAAFVYYNGALVRDEREGIEVHVPIPQALSAKILDYCVQEYPDCIIGAERLDVWYSNKVIDGVTYHLRSSPVILPLEELQPLEPTKFNISGIHDVNPLRDLFGDLANIVATDGGTLIQIMNKGVSKASGILALCRHYGVKPAEIMVFGDDVNDLEMFQLSGFPVAMQHAVPELKKIAKEVTDTNDNDGAAKVLERFVRKTG